MNIGILYPRSKAHPGITVEFMDGLKLYLNKAQLDEKVKLFSESIGFGGSEKEVYEKAEKLLLLEEVDILVAYIDLKVISILEPLLQASGKLMLVVNPGANYPESWIPQTNIIHLTLQHAFLCWLNGQQAAQQKNTNGLMASTFYDCGYGLTAMMVNAFVQQGGNILFNYINRLTYDELFHINELTDFLSSDTTTDHLLCAFDTLPASLFYKTLNKYTGADALHLYVSPMMLEPTAFDNGKEGFRFSIEGYLAWEVSGGNADNLDFTGNYLSKTQKTPGIFSLLGWETAMILEQVFLTGIPGNEGTKIVASLYGGKIKGPRGELILDPKTNYFIAPFIKCSIKNNSGKMEMEPIDFPVDAWEVYVANPTSGASSGWLNTYLCY